MKYVVSKRTGRTFELGERIVGYFETFDEAYNFATSFCENICSEGYAGIGISFFMSDDNSPNVPYKVRITAEK